MSTEIRMVNDRRNPKVEDFVRRHLETAVGRFCDRLSFIDVRVRDENASKGGVDQSCSIDARLIPRGTLHVQATEADIYEAILKAVRRLEAVVAKTVDRGHRSKAVRHGQRGSRSMDIPVSDQLETG